MRTRPDRDKADRQEILQRRLELIPGGLATDWRMPDDEEAPERLAPVVGAEWSEIPMPGRHASRRERDWTQTLPEPLRGRIELGPGQLALIALVVAAALAVTCWWLLRSAASSAAAPAPVIAGASPMVSLATPGASPAAATSGASAWIEVDVEGPVRHPGVHRLRAGARVVDAIRAAGGARRRQALAGTNLAAVLTDGQQVVVGAPAVSSAGAGPAAVTGGAAVPAGKIDLNTATADDLDQIPGIGPVTAQAIIGWRTQNGPFTSVDELEEVNGIGPPIWG